MTRSTRVGKNHFIAGKENQKSELRRRILFLDHKVLVPGAT